MIGRLDVPHLRFWLGASALFAISCGGTARCPQLPQESQICQTLSYSTVRGPTIFDDVQVTSDGIVEFVSGDVLPLGSRLVSVIDGRLQLKEESSPLVTVTSIAPLTQSGSYRVRAVFDKHLNAPVELAGPIADASGPVVRRDHLYLSQVVAPLLQPQVRYDVKLANSITLQSVIVRCPNSMFATQVWAEHGSRWLVESYLQPIYYKKHIPRN